MHFLYVDESGDPGPFDPARNQTGSAHFILSGLVIPASDWRNYLSAMVDIRKLLKTQFGLPARAELHAAELINPRGNALYQKLPGGRSGRISLYRTTLQSAVSRMANARFIHVYCDKAKYTRKDIEEEAWKRMIERFHTHLKKDRNGEPGMVFADATNEVRLRKQLRRMRNFHYVPSRYGTRGVSATADLIIEDPVIRDSRASYFVQLADLASHALYRKVSPKGSLRRFNVDKLFDSLDPLLLKRATGNDPWGQGIVRF